MYIYIQHYPELNHYHLSVSIYSKNIQRPPYAASQLLCPPIPHPADSTSSISWVCFAASKSIFHDFHIHISISGQEIALVCRCFKCTRVVLLHYWSTPCSLLKNSKSCMVFHHRICPILYWWTFRLSGISSSWETMVPSETWQDLVQCDKGPSLFGSALPWLQKCVSLSP